VYLTLVYNKDVCIYVLFDVMKMAFSHLIKFKSRFSPLRSLATHAYSLNEVKLRDIPTTDIQYFKLSLVRNEDIHHIPEGQLVAIKPWYSTLFSSDTVDESKVDDKPDEQKNNNQKWNDNSRETRKYSHDSNRSNDIPSFTFNINSPKSSNQTKSSIKSKSSDADPTKTSSTSNPISSTIPNLNSVPTDTFWEANNSMFQKALKQQNSEKSWSETYDPWESSSTSSSSTPKTTKEKSNAHSFLDADSFKSTEDLWEIRNKDFQQQLQHQDMKVGEAWNETNSWGNEKSSKPTTTSSSSSSTPSSSSNNNSNNQALIIIGILAIVGPLIYNAYRAWKNANYLYQIKQKPIDIPSYPWGTKYYRLIAISPEAAIQVPKQELAFREKKSSHYDQRKEYLK
jgi:hypothetical protein